MPATEWQLANHTPGGKTQLYPPWDDVINIIAIIVHNNDFFCISIFRNLQSVTVLEFEPGRILYVRGEQT